MGYVLPSFEELPLPTREEFNKNPGYYWKKLEEFKTRPRLFGVLTYPHCIEKWIIRNRKRNSNA